MFTNVGSMGRSKKPNNSKYKDITDGLVSRWRFDEGTGATVSDSWGSNDGTAAGGMTWPEGKVGAYCGGFDAVDDKVTVPYVAELATNESSVFTWSCWVKTTATIIGENTIMSQSDVNYRGTFLSMNGGPVACLFIDSWGVGDYLWRGGTTVVSDGTWHHVVVTYDGGETVSSIDIYVDGELDGVGTNIDTLGGASVATTGTFKIGTNTHNVSVVEFFDGDIDDARVYNRVLSPTEVAQIYNKFK
jgi:hypothetical protein